MSLFSFLFRKERGPSPASGKSIPEEPAPPARALNVLLYLSTKQLPHPVDEMLELERRAEDPVNGSDSVPFITTRFLSGLNAGESEVALYCSDEKGGYELLAVANFRGFVGRGTADWDELIDNDPTYGIDRMPETARGAIRLGALKLSDSGSSSIAALDGLLANGQRLTDELIKSSPISDHEIGFQYTSVYYVKAGGGGQNVTTEEQTALLSAKNDELLDKVFQLAEFWNEKKARLQDILNDRDEIEQKLKNVVLELKSQVDTKIVISSRGQKAARFDSLIDTLFRNIKFLADSGSFLFDYYAKYEKAWDAIRFLNENGYVDKERYTVKNFQGTKHWEEVKLSGVRRFYYRQPPSGSSQLRVLVSLRQFQEGRDTRLMHSNDED